MDDKTLSNVLKLLYNSSRDEISLLEPNDESVMPMECQNSIYDNVQIFSDHLKATSRFQKTLYYRDLSHTSFHPPFALTDATLELFNKTVPNAGRLDILNMDYAASLSRTVCVSPYSMVLAMMYLEQLRHKNPDYLESVSPRELFVVSILVASKYLFDNDEEYIYNSDWAEAAHMDVRDLNRLEKDFLQAINWELFITSSDFFHFLCQIENRIAIKWTSKRGWLSYTDICVMSRNKLFAEFLVQVSKAVVKVVLIVTVGYVSALVVLYGAFSVTILFQRPAKAAVQAMLAVDYSLIKLPEFPWLPSHESVHLRRDEKPCNLSYNLQDNCDENLKPISHTSTDFGGIVQQCSYMLNQGSLNDFCCHKEDLPSSMKQTYGMLSFPDSHVIVTPPVQCYSVVTLHDCNYSLSHT